MRIRPGFLALPIGLLFFAWQGRANVVYNNFANTIDSYGSMWKPWAGEAQQFITDASGDSLASVVLKLRQVTAGAVTVSIYSNDTAHDIPDVLVATLTGPSPDFIADSSYHDYTFTPASALNLQAGQEYWVVAFATSGWYLWAETANETGAGAWFSSLSAYHTESGSWLSSSVYDTQLMQVNTVPEPAAWLLVAAGGIALFLKRRLA